MALSSVAGTPTTKFYIDGILDGNSPAITGPQGDPWESIGFAGNGSPTGSGSNMGGEYGIMLLYERQLTDEEISMAHDLMLYWYLNGEAPT